MKVQVQEKTLSDDSIVFNVWVRDDLSFGGLIIFEFECIDEEAAHTLVATIEKTVLSISSP